MERDIENLMGYNVNVVSHFIKNSYNEKLAEFGLTNAQAKVIYFLAKYGKQTQTDLQNKLYIKPSSMNGIIDTLQKKALVEKQESNTDKRTKMITLSEDGQQLDVKIRDTILDIEANITKGFSDEEQQIILTWLRKMQTNLKREMAGRE